MPNLWKSNGREGAKGERDKPYRGRDEARAGLSLLWQLRQWLFSPLDEQLKLSKKNWSPETIQNAVRLGVEIASYERAAATFEALTRIPLSKSSLQRLVNETGAILVEEQEAEAKAMVQIPKKEEEVVWREAPAPDSEVMSVSSDGVMVNIIDEGWKEVKAVSVSAVSRSVNEESGEVEVHLSNHSYRAGLWDAATFTNHHWAESCRRGLEKATTIVCISDGALWIWAMVFLCFSRRIEVLDWWHAVQRLWAIALGTYDPVNAAPWVAQAKGCLARSQLRYLFRQIRRLYPRGTPLPESVRQAIGYLFRNRHRMDYASFRQQGLPIGSRTIESACKTVVQARMKQAGMRWSRNGAQSMIALRCLLLSDRWNEIPLPT